MTTDNQEMFECVIPLPDALIRKPMGEPSKSVKHGDHDQSDHGNWADGSGDGSKENPIRTNSVEDAARALGEGKHVELRTPDQVAVLLDRLNELAKEAEAAGSKAKNIDLCQLTVPGTNLFCVESKGIPRVEMPQLKGIPNSGSAASDLPADKRGEVDITEAYLERLRSSGVSLAEDEALASHLKATQNELNGGKVAGIMQAARAGELDLNQPIVVSKDGYIVDGHHRWAAKVALEHDGIDDPETDMKIPVVRVDQDILEILESSKQFAADMGLPQVAVKSLKHADHDQSEHGNWATGGSDGQYTGKPRSAASRARMGEHTDRYGDPERRESGRRSGSRNLGREVTYMEIVALESYKGGGYGEINRFLRGTQEGDDWTKDRIDAVKSLALPTTEPMTVTRMMPLFAVEGIAAGQIYEDKGFMSTGKGDRPAQFFHGYPVQMQIEVPAGTPVVDFDNFTGLDGWGNIEREVTLMPNSQLIIDRVEQRDWNRDFGPTETDGLKIYARLVPPTKSVKHADHDQSEHGNWASANTEKSGPQAWLGINALSDVPKYKIGSPSEASEPQVAARIAENISQFKNAGGVVTRLPILPNAGVTGSYSYAETPEQEATSDWLFREAESARASADEYELRAQDASSQEEQDKLLSIASGYSHMATALDRASGGGTFIATTGGERGTIVGVLAGSFNSGEWEATMFGSSQSVAGTGSALMYAAIEAVADADKVSRLAITFPEPESLPFYRAFGFTPESGTWESKPNPSGVILSRGSAVRIDEAVSGMTPASIVAQYGLTKSIKHGDHDQSDHGNWASGNAFGYTAGKLPLSVNNQSPAANEILMLAQELQAEGRGEPLADPMEDDQYGGESTYSKSDELLSNAGVAIRGADVFIKGWTASVEDSTRYRQEAEILAKGGDAFAVSQGTLAGLRLVEASAPTQEQMYRGLSMSAEDLARYKVGSEVPLSFAAFTTARGESEQFASSTNDKQAVQLVLESGAKAIPMVAFDPNSVLGEHVTSGWFEVVNVGTTKVTNSFLATNEITQITLRHSGTFDLGSAIKSVKHGDHDQSDHGNWAHGNAAIPALSATDKKEGEKYLIERYPPEDRNRDSDLGKKLGLTSLEWAAADHYRTQGYMEINNLLRGKGSDWGREFAPADIRSVQLLDKAMDKSTIKTFETVYRGTSMLASKMDTFLSGLEVGGVYTDPSFTSTSRGEDIAESFATDRPPDEAKESRASVMWEIVLPPGTSALDMQSLFPNFGSNEEEVLLDRDTHLRILAKESAGETLDGEPVYRIKAIAIPTATKSLKHADHDQSEHGNWASGGSTPESAQSRALFAKDAPEAYISKNEREELARKWGEKLDRQITERDVLSLDNYKRWGSAEINQYLRGQSEPSGDRKGFVQDRIDGIRNLAKPLDRDTVVYRWVPNETSTGEPISSMLQKAYENGTTVSDSGFMSTSTEVTGGQAWGKNFIAIEVPAGTPVVDFNDWMTTLNAEQEILLMPDTTLMLTYAQTLEDGSRRFVASVVEPAKKSYKHADHDQLDHGSWADGSVPLAKTPIEQVDSLRQWSSNSYDQVNKALRDPKILAAQERGGNREMWQKTQDGLDLLFKGVPTTTRPWTLYRGATGEFVTDLVKQYDSMIAKGEEEYRATGKPPASFVLPRFTDQGFVSTTPDKNVAMHFTGSGFQGGPFYTGDGRAIFEINYPEGSKMVNVEEYATEFGGFASYAREESEFLLPRGLTFEVTDVTPSDEQFGSQGPVFYTIKLDVVPSSTKSYKHADHDQSDHGSWADGERYTAEARNNAERALTHYSIDGYQRINSYLRKTDMSQDEWQTQEFDPEPVIKEIDSLFESAAPLKEPVTVFRGIDSEVAEKMTWKQGDTYTDAAFMSTSLREEVSERFTGYGGKGTYIMQIEVPAGTTALTPSMFASLVDEDEVILNRGTTLQITGTELKDNFNYIYASVVPATKSLKHADHDQSDHGNWATGSSGITPPTEDQYKSVLSYTEGSGFINSRLRAGYDPHDISPRVKDLDDLIASQPLSEDTVVYRGGKWSLLHFDPNVSVGQQLTDKAFLSTTTDGGYARTFITQAFSPAPVTEGDKETNIMMEILLPKGFPALDIDATMESYGKQNYKSEHEILLPRGAVLEVTAVEERPLFPMDSSQTQTVTHITAKVVPSSTTKSYKHADHDQSDHGSWATGSSASPEMTKNQYDTVHEYTRNGYRNLNETLREGDREDVEYELESERVKALDALIAANSLTKDTVVYRGVKLNDDQRWDYGNYTDWKYVNSGDILQDEGYMSTAKSYNEAAKFMSFGGHSGQPIMFEITVPAGSPALDVNAAMKDYESKNGSSLFYPYESEILLPRQTRLEITGKSEDENGRLVISATVSPLPTKSIKHGDHDQSDHGNWATGSEFRSPSSEDRGRTPKGSATSTPYAAHYYDTQQRQRLDMALDAYTHWKPENSGDTEADRPFHAVLNENLRNGMNRGKAVEAASAEFATGDEKDDEATANDLYEGFMSLDSATENSRMMEDTVVTRASSPIIYLDELEAAAAGGSLELYGFDISQGAVFSDAGFVSTSLDTTGQSTQYFANRWDTEGLDDNQIPTSVRWNITVPEGAPALDLRALEFGSQHGEQEVILPRNTHFRVDSWDVQLPKFEGRPASVTINATVIPTHAKP